MEKIEEDQLVKMILVFDVRDVRLRGKPQMGWMDDVKNIE